ncbi:hypothetical protein M5K25_005775 [Dendrobium thyrsiflorum]|uniref:Uncharacterized protein n=1 Tax=Dendrobium thyrsiflorum TaxID=117978 RepID=A0ABD0VIM9_DENTH
MKVDIKGEGSLSKKPTSEISGGGFIRPYKQTHTYTNAKTDTKAKSYTHSDTSIEPIGLPKNRTYRSGKKALENPKLSITGNHTHRVRLILPHTRIKTKPRFHFEISIKKP